MQAFSISTIFCKRSSLTALGSVAFGLIFGSLILFPSLFFEIHLSTAAVAGIGCLGLCVSIFERKKAAPEALRFAALFLLVLYLISDLPLRAHGFTQHSVPVAFLASFLVLCWFLLRRYSSVYLTCLAVLSSLAAITGFVRNSGGALLLSDDHSAFLYRLIQLKSNFPYIPFYNPLWNAGVEAREFFASGALNFFVLFSPLIYFFDTTAVYNWLVLALLFVAVPLSAFAAARLSGRSQTCALILATLSQCSSLFWYRWALSYGTLGFILSASLVPLNLVLFSTIANGRVRISLTRAVLTALSFTLMLLWSPSALLFLPLGILLVPRFGNLARSSGAWLTLCLLLLLNAPWITVFYKVSNVADFVATSAEMPEAEMAESAHDISKFRIPDAKTDNLHWTSATLKNLRRNLLPLNPLILILGAAGLLLMRRSTDKAVLIVTAVWAVLLGSVGPLIKPQLELERMIIILAGVLAVPTAEFMAESLTSSSRLSRIQAALLIALLSLSPFWLWRITSNLTTERYSTADSEVTDLAAAIKQHAGDGRVLFTGFTLHALSGGHVAPLAAWTGKPLIAMSYQHDRWRYTDVIPEEYRSRKAPGVFEYLDLMNVSVVLTHERFWRKWFMGQRASFERVWEGAGFQLFRRKNNEPGYFHHGDGQILEQTGDRVLLSIDSPDAVIKFNYLPFLEASGCELSAARISDSVTFIRLQNCENPGQIEIRAKPVWQRDF